MALGIDLVLGVAASYVANHIPTLVDNGMENRIEKAYHKAVQKWTCNDSIRKSLSSRKFAHIEGLMEQLSSPCSLVHERHLISLIELWAEELRNDELCYNFILEYKQDLTNKKLDRQFEVYSKLDEKLDKQNKKLDNILNFLETEKDSAYSYGITKHNPVEGYIKRYCTTDKDHLNSVDYILNEKAKNTLSDYVTGVVSTTRNKFILYSSAQTGKTTELKNLCYELQESRLFFPVLFEVRNNSNLQRAQLPSKQFIEDKEIVIVIDALDEVNGAKRENLLEEIGAYASENPEIKMILSCRSNYRRNDKFDLFQEIYLEKLQTSDVAQYIRSIFGEYTDVVRQLYTSGLEEFLEIPFYLKVLISTYKKDGSLPHKKHEIYKIFFEDSLNTQIKVKGPNIIACSKEKIYFNLERIALAQSLLNEQTMSYEQILSTVNGDRDELEACNRCDIVKSEDDVWSFSHNALREYLVAEYLHKNGLITAKRLATHPNGRIKPEWHNIIMLWLSMYGEDENEEVTHTVDWLKESGIELISYIDRDFVDESVRNTIFKSILDQYKNLGIRLGSYGSDDYSRLINFAFSKETINFLIQEIKNADFNSIYYSDLMCICHALNWVNLKTYGLLYNLLDEIDKKIIDNLKNDEDNDLFLIYLDNKFFFTEEYVERYVNIFQTSNNRYALNHTISLIFKANCVDKYSDFIFSKEKLVRDYRHNGITRLMTRGGVYFAFSRIKEPENIKRLLKHEFEDPFYYLGSEWDAYFFMIKSILPLAFKIATTCDKDMLQTILDYYCRIYQHHTYGPMQDSKASDLLNVLRAEFNIHGFDKIYRNTFLSDWHDLVSNPNTERKSIDKLFLLTGLWMNKEDVNGYYNDFDTTNEIDKALASRLSCCIYKEVAIHANNKYLEFFTESPFIIKNRVRRISHLRDFADYDIFKQSVLENIKYFEHYTRQEYYRKFKNDPDCSNEYVLRFVYMFTNDNGYFNTSEIIKAVKDRNYYESFFMCELSDCLITGHKKDIYDDTYTKRIIKEAKRGIEKYAEDADYPFMGPAIKLMLSGFINVDEHVLIKLLPFSSIFITKQDKDIFNQTYTLFDFLCANVDKTVLGLAILDSYKRPDSVFYKRNVRAFSDYLLDNNIPDSDEVLYYRVSAGEDDYLDIADCLIEHNLKIEELKILAESYDDDRFISICHSFLRVKKTKKWIKNQLEHRFINLDANLSIESLQMLLPLGSIIALKYLVEHDNLLHSVYDLNIQFDSQNAIDLLLLILPKLDNNNISHSKSLNSVISSLERIALKHSNAYEKISNGLRKIVEQNSSLCYLNRHIMMLENKHYASFSGYNDINQVLALIDNKES